MNDSYYIRMQGLSLGPYTLDRVRQMTRKGQVGKVHEVSTDGVSWAPATTFPEIFERPANTVTAAAVTAQPATTQQAAPAATAPAPVPAEAQWYYAVNGSQQGPIAHSQMMAMIRSGTVAGTDYVYQEGGDDWIQAADAPELAIAFGPQAGGAASRGGTPGIDAFCSACGAGVNRRAIMCPKCGAPVAQESLPPVASEFQVQFPTSASAPQRRSGDAKSKTTAALLALLIGGLGVHHFYLGNTPMGVIYLLFCWTLIPWIASLIEGIILLTMSDAAFDAKYNC